VHAAAHFSDCFPSVTSAGGTPRTLVGTAIYAAPGAPVIAVQDGRIVQIGDSPTLGRFVVLRDAFGNTYTYAQLGDVALVYPVLQPHVHSTVSTRISGPARRERAPTGPATAGAQPRSPLAPSATVSGLALGAAAALEAAPPAPPASAQAPTAPVRPPAGAAKLRVFRSGQSDVYLHSLHSGAQVIAGTVLGHVGSAGAGLGAGGGAGTSGASLGAGGAGGAAGAGGAHILFQIRPAGAGAPLIDPKPILDGWVALENTSIFHARGENPFLATSPTIGQVLLESKQQLEPQVLHDGGVRLGRCGRQDVQGGRVDRRVLAMLEYLSVSGLEPTVGGLPCGGSTPAAQLANPAASATSASVRITAVNGVPIAGHQGQGSLADETVRKLLGLQGLSRPRRIVSLLDYPSASIAFASSRARDAIAVSFAPQRASRTAGLGTTLSPREWTRLTARLGEIPDPTVGRGPSAAAIRVRPPAGAGASGGNG
jgi:hypothetical protein